MHWLLSGLVISAAVTAFAPYAFATADGCAFVIRTSDGFVSIRAHPHSKAKVLARVESGQVIVIDTKEGDPLGRWTHVNMILRATNEGRFVNLKMLDGWVRDTHIRSIDCERLDRVEQSSQPWAGTWAATLNACKPENLLAEGEEAPVRISNVEIAGLENTCQIKNVQEIEGQRTWHLVLKCFGEGEFYDESAVFTMPSKDRLIQISSNGFKVEWVRCPG